MAVDERNSIGIIQAVFVIPALYYFVTRLWFPARYWREQERAHRPKSRLSKGLEYAGYCWLWIGFGILGFYVVGGLFSWMPDSWGSVDEGGEWETTRDWIQRTAGAFGGLACMIRLSEMGENFAKRNVEERFTSAVLVALRKPQRPNDSVTDIRNRHVEAARTALSPPSMRHEEDAERAYREKLLSWLDS